jgi:hypothetical protein
MNFKETEKELREFAQYVIQQARSNLTREGKKTTSSLYDSLDYEIELEKGALLVDFIMEDYGEFVDQGVKGKNPYNLPKGAKWHGIQKAPTSPYKFGRNKSKGLRAAINRWTIQKGIKGIRDSKGRFIGRKSLQFLITRSIYLSGLRATLFFTKPFNKGLQRFTDKFIDAFALDVENGIILGTKK